MAVDTSTMTEDEQRELGIKLGLSVRATMEYQAEIDATPKGRESRRLRERGHPLSNASDQAQAHPFFLDAAALFADNDEGAAAASAWFDLAESFKRLHDGRDRENLLEAERLLRRCLGSRSRRRDVLRLAQTHDALGQVLRRRAALSHLLEEGETLEQEAQGELERACELMESLPVVGWVHAGRYRTNLANLLAQRGRLDEAIESCQQGLAHIENAAQHPGLVEGANLDMPPLPGVSMRLASLLLRSEDPCHLERILSLTKVARTQGDPVRASTAALVAAVALHRYQPERRDEAERMLREVDLATLEPTRDWQYLELMIDLELLDAALFAVRRGSAQALEQRGSSFGEHVADAAAEQAQRYGLLEAQIHLGRDQPLEAFLALENLSALRYLDHVQAWGWEPRVPMARALVAYCRALSSAGMIADSQAGYLAELQPDQVLEVLQKLEVQYRAIAGNDAQTLCKLLEIEEEDLSAQLEQERQHDHVGAHRVSREWLALTFEECASHPTPIPHLRQRVAELLAHIAQLNREASRFDPENCHDAQHTITALGPSELEKIVEEAAGRVLLRVHWSRELVAVAVWRSESGQLVARGGRFPLEEGSLEAVLRLTSFRDPNSPPQRPRPGAVAELLAALDLGDLLPEIKVAPTGELILLPSTYAALVPWAAAGRPGETMLDRFVSISWLPNLTPLRMRQVPRRHRSGTLCVYPGSAPKSAPTRCHDLAYAQPLEDEIHLRNGDASVERLQELLVDADVVSFYAHGRYELWNSARIRLANGHLKVNELGPDWAGCERVELWSCRSGVNLSTDILTPKAVDEAFGMDIAFHHAGVRSTIGTLWKVMELVTAHLLRRYRQHLREGVRSPQALADAQRWWRDQALTDIRRILSTNNSKDGLRAIRGYLGVDEVAREWGDLLGDSPKPSSDRRLSSSEVDALMNKLSPPEAWAGYRFTGVCERRPIGEPLPETIKLDESERAELQLLVVPRPSKDPDPDQQQRAWRQQSAKLRPGEAPSVQQAITVSRAYFDAREGCRRHFLLRGAAWLSEALAHSKSARVRRRLHRELGWFWLELARNNDPEERVRVFTPPDRVYVGRLNAAITSVPKSLDGRMFAQWLWLLEQPPVRSFDELAARDADLLSRWHELWKNVRRTPLDTHEGLRLRAGALAFLLVLQEIPEEVVTELLLEHVWPDDLPSSLRWAQARVLAECAALADRIGAQEVSAQPAITLIGHREMARNLSRLRRRIFQQQQPLGDLHGLNEAEGRILGLLEGDFWGYPADSTNFWLSASTPGRAWYEIVGAYYQTRLEHKPSPRGALHFIAGLNMGSDLHLGPLSAAARCRAALPLQLRRSTGQPWEVVARRRQLFATFEDAARTPALESLDEWILHPAGQDPFRRSRSDLFAPPEGDPTSLVGWQFAAWLSLLQKESEVAMDSRCAAFEAERRLLEFDRASLEMMPTLDGEVELLTSTLGRDSKVDFGRLRTSALPLLPIEAAESLLQESVPLGSAVLGVGTGEHGDLLLSLIVKNESGFSTRIQIRREVALRIQASLMSLFGPFWGLESADQRSTAWSDLCAGLDPMLEEVLAGLAPGSSLSILSPGRLRPLPWAGLTRSGRPLWRDFNVSLLPHIGFGQASLTMPHRTQPRVVCALGGGGGLEILFGEAVIHTLRAHFPVAAKAEPSFDVPGRTIHEVDIILDHASELTSLRFYGAPPDHDWGDSVSAVQLSGRRCFSAFNTGQLALRSCECVELWSATTQVGQLRLIQGGDRDQIPGLARSFLASGSAGVVDLAWPVHDLVKALVCERFGILRHVQNFPSPKALTHALREVEMLTEQWAGEVSGQSLHTALTRLDELRAVHARGVGLSRANVRCFAHLSDAPSIRALRIKTLLLQCRQADQLAAFRFWGAPQPGSL